MPAMLTIDAQQKEPGQKGLSGRGVPLMYLVELGGSSP